ncbi:MAG: hypothetical protein QM489_07400 [Candidatus Izemoplasma sp.]
MKNNDLYNKINQQLDGDTPDILERIKSSNRFFVPVKQRPRKTYSFGLRTAFASFAVIFVILFTFVLTGENTDAIVASTITLDINPSIEITLDEFDNVINVRALNNDGNELIDRDLLYSEMTVDETIKLLINRAVYLGYISDEQNAILISVNNNNETERTRVINHLELRIDIEIRNNNINPDIIRDNVIDSIPNPNFTDEQLAIAYEITVAKVRLINSIINLDGDYTIIQLKDKHIWELVKIRSALLP